MKLIEPTALPTWSRGAVEVLVQHPVGVSVDCSVKVAHPALLLLPFNVSRKSSGSGVEMWPRLGRPGSASWVLLRISSLKNHQMCNSREAILGK